MSKTKIVLACVFLSSALVMTAAAQGGNIPVTATISGSYPDTTFSIESDGLGPYYDSLDGVLSNIMRKPDLYGMWVLGTGGPRNVSITFDCLTGPCTTTTRPPFSGGVTIKAQSNLSYAQYAGTNMLSMTTSQVILCPLLVMFSDVDGGYQIHMGKVGGPVVYPVVDDGTTPAKITCLSVANQSCNNWNIEPYGGGYSIGRLWRAGGTKKIPSYTSLGDFKFSFFINVTNP